DEHSGFAVSEPNVAPVFQGVFDCRDVREANRRAILICDDQRTILGCREQLVGCGELPGMLPIVERALWPVCICCGQSRLNLFPTDVELRQRRGVDLEANGGL